MKRSLILIISLFCLSSLLVVPATDAATRKQARKEYKEKKKKVAWVQDEKKLYISGKFTGGILTGKAADYFDDTSEKVIYGFGLCIEYLSHPNLMIGINSEIAWKDLSPYSDGAIRGLSFSASGMYLFYKNSRSSPYVRLELGGIYCYWINNVDVGTHSFYRIGLGYNTHFTKYTVGRFELFYRTIFCDGYEMKCFRGTVDGNANYFGFDITFGLKH